MSESQLQPYVVHMDARYQALELVDVPALVDACTDKWYNQTLCEVNDSVASYGCQQDFVI